MNCAICEQPITLEEEPYAHHLHVFGCPCLTSREPLDCTCDEKRYAHPQCCPECNNLGKAILKRLIVAAIGEEAFKEAIKEAKRKQQAHWN